MKNGRSTCIILLTGEMIKDQAENMIIGYGSCETSVCGWYRSEELKKSSNSTLI